VHIVVLAACFLLCGCAGTQTSPSFDRAWVHLDQAERSSQGEAAIAIKKAREQLNAAEKACSENTELADRYAREISSLQSKADYWKEKQRKALRELWVWRGLLLAAVLFAARGPILWGLRKLVGIPW